jgi:hypothetical protein
MARHARELRRSVETLETAQKILITKTNELEQRTLPDLERRKFELEKGIKKLDSKLAKRRHEHVRLEDMVGLLRMEEQDLARRVLVHRRKQLIWGAAIRVVYFVGLGWGLIGAMLFVLGALE